MTRPTSRLARYPAVFSRILLAIPANGEPLDLATKSPFQAQEQRLQFYNFLKFVRRNPQECAHLYADDRPSRISILVQGSVLRFVLRSPTTNLEAAFTAATGATPSAAPVPATLPMPYVPDISEAVANDLQLPDLNEPLNLFDRLNADPTTIKGEPK